MLWHGGLLCELTPLGRRTLPACRRDWLSNSGEANIEHLEVSSTPPLQQQQRQQQQQAAGAGGHNDDEQRWEERQGVAPAPPAARQQPLLPGLPVWVAASPPVPRPPSQQASPLQQHRFKLQQQWQGSLYDLAGMDLSDLPF